MQGPVQSHPERAGHRAPGSVPSAVGWQAPLSEASSRGEGWSRVDPADEAALLSQLQEGEFWVEEEEFLREFDEVTVGFPVTEAGHLQSLYSGEGRPPSPGPAPGAGSTGLVRRSGPSGRPRPQPATFSAERRFCGSRPWRCRCWETRRSLPWAPWLAMARGRTGGAGALPWSQRSVLCLEKELCHTQELPGAWVKGQSAGGCRNNSGFPSNPKFWLRVSEPSELYVAVLQRPRARPAGRAARAWAPDGGVSWSPASPRGKDYQAVGLHIWKVTPPGRPCPPRLAHQLVLPSPAPGTAPSRPASAPPRAGWRGGSQPARSPRLAGTLSWALPCWGGAHSPGALSVPGEGGGPLTGPRHTGPLSAGGEAAGQPAQGPVHAPRGWHRVPCLRPGGAPAL